MNYHITWSPTARVSYLAILEYLDEHWTKREVRGFAAKSKKNISLIAQNPFLFQYSNESKTFRCVLVRQVSLYYRIRDKQVELLTFWDNRRDPGTLRL